MLPKIIVINREQLQDIIVAHLYALSILDDNEEVSYLEIEEVTDDDVTLILTMEPKR